MAFISGFGGGGFNAFSGSIDPTSEGLVSALEGTSFAPSFDPFSASASAFAGPQFSVGANPLMQILPMLLGSLQGLGQGWGGFVGAPQQGGGFAPQQPQRCH